MINNIKQLKGILQVPSYTGREYLMIHHICSILSKMNIPYYLDEHYNIYATKGELNDGEYYPCIVAHTDTVHHSLEPIIIQEEMLPNFNNELKLSYRGINTYGGRVGIGGDDKCGIYAAIRMLTHLPKVKAAFFVSEENGCWGSRYADPKFFENVGYAIQYDSPEGNTVSKTLMGESLYDSKSKFGKTVERLLEKYVGYDVEYCHHPYTDVYCIKTQFNIECINLPAAYYLYHTKNEYVVVEELINNVKMGVKLIQKLGYVKFPMKAIKLPFPKVTNPNS